MSDNISEKYCRTLRDKFSAFIEYCFKEANPGTEFLPNWHIDCIAEYLEAARRGELKRLIINMPPRALKSLSVTVAWPAFLLGHHPSARIIAASYASSLAIRHSLDSRLVLGSRWYQKTFPETRIAVGENLKHRFTTTQRGFRFATSVGGSVTGDGGNFLIVDDPHNPVQARGETTRNVANRWFDNSFATRLNDKKKGVIVVVMQRLHPNDLTGHLLAKGGWEQLVLPAIATERTIVDFRNFQYERELGEPLHIAREDAELLERAKRELGSAVWGAQYQQQPLPVGGNIVRGHWLKRFDLSLRGEAEAIHLNKRTLQDGSPRPEGLAMTILRTVQSWDTGIKAGEHNDPSACATFAETREGYYLLDMVVMREEYPNLKRAIVNLADQWKPDAILIEDKASGQSLLQDLKRETKLPLIGVNPVGDKVTRLAAVSALIEAGKVFLPNHASWLAAFESELLAFPSVAHDDQVDAFSQFLHWAKASPIPAAMTIRRV